MTFESPLNGPKVIFPHCTDLIEQYCDFQPPGGEFVYISNRYNKYTLSKKTLFGQPGVKNTLD